MSVSPPQVTTESTPDLTVTQIWYEGIQDSLYILGVFGIGVPALLQSPQVVLQLAGALAGLTAVAMSVIDKIRAQRAAHASAKASALIGRAVRLT